MKYDIFIIIYVSNSQTRTQLRYYFKMIKQNIVAMAALYMYHKITFYFKILCSTLYYSELFGFYINYKLQYTVVLIS